MDVPKICMFIADTFNLERRVISRRDGSKYLTRFYIYRKTKKWMPSIYLHCFHSSDQDMELHDHPWKISSSVILSGKYKEEKLINKEIVDRFFGPGKINIIKGTDFHRVDLLTNEVWTLFISGPKTRDWGFMDRDTGKFISNEEHEKRKQNKWPKKIIRDMSTPEKREYWESTERIAKQIEDLPEYARTLGYKSGDP